VDCNCRSSAGKPLYQQAETSELFWRAIVLGLMLRNHVWIGKKGYLPDFNLGASYGARANTPSGDKRADLLSFEPEHKCTNFCRPKTGQSGWSAYQRIIGRRNILTDEWNKVRSQITQGYTDYQRAKIKLCCLKPASCRRQDKPLPRCWRVISQQGRLSEFST